MLFLAWVAIDRGGASHMSDYKHKTLARRGQLLRSHRPALLGVVSLVNRLRSYAHMQVAAGRVFDDIRG